VEAKFSTRNHFSGKVTQLQMSAVNSEVTLEIPGGGAIVAIITNESAARLDLQPDRLNSPQAQARHAGL